MTAAAPAGPIVVVVSLVVQPALVPGATRVATDAPSLAQTAGPALTILAHGAAPAVGD